MPDNASTLATLSQVADSEMEAATQLVRRAQDAKQKDDGTPRWATVNGDSGSVGGAERRGEDDDGGGSGSADEEQERRAKGEYSPRGSSQELSSEAQYGALDKPPAFGQVCRCADHQTPFYPFFCADRRQ
jgi:hypothetical protein